LANDPDFDPVFRSLLAAANAAVAIQTHTSALTLALTEATAGVQHARNQSSDLRETVARHETLILDLQQQILDLQRQINEGRS